MIYSGILVIFKKHFARLLFASIFLLFVPGLYAQHIEKLRHANCTDLCAHSRVFNSGNGIYSQDERLHDYDVKFYGIELDVLPSSTYLMGKVRVKAEVIASHIQYFVLELTQELLVSEVIFEEKSLAFSHQNQVLEINLGEEYASGHMIDLEITYQGMPQPEGFFSGIQSSGNAFGDPVLWTLSEPYNARQWFPCKQVLADKADSVFVTVITPAGFMAASNGLLMNVSELPDDKIRYEWRTFYPIAYYLISIAVSNYQEHNFYAPLAQEQDSVFVQNFIYNHPTVLENNREALERTKGFMHVFSQVWGDYPFKNEKYGHAQAPMGGAMEHQTISTMGSLGFDITAHELAHHWFGNHVTCATWSDIWINEGFASYGEFLAREFLEGQEAANAWMNAAHNNIKSEPDGSIYVPPYELGNIWRIFNGRLSYRKGAAMLHLLRFELDNDELFFQIMEDFQQSFAHDVATGDDFRRTIDLNTGQNWEWFFDQWYYGEGYPVYELQWWQESGKLIIRSSQTTSATFPEFFKGTIEFRVVAQGEEHLLRLIQDEPLQLFEIPFSGQIEEIVFNPRSYMLMYFTLADSTGIIVPQVENLPQVKPNPFVDQLFLQVPDLWVNSSFFIADLQGRIVLEGRISLNKHHINTSTFRAGVYLLVLTAPSGKTQSFKLVRY